MSEMDPRESYTCQPTVEQYSGMNQKKWWAKVYSISPVTLTPNITAANGPPITPN
ncbi:hypothetical protein IW146_000215 [Coemansia sp. RSA 922]|nr:hypothetical protein GGI09_001816 [Coemansia sp. S100]KAJ2118079.1 hypothetical protein IW146_000215 [Coemansia sp. RSA 922]